MDIALELNFKNIKTSFLITHFNNGEPTDNSDKVESKSNTKEADYEWLGRKVTRSGAEICKLLESDNRAQSNNLQAKSIHERAIVSSKSKEESRSVNPSSSLCESLASLNAESDELSWTKVTGVPEHYCFSKKELPSSTKRLEAACNQLETFLKEKLEALKEEYFGKKDSSGKYTNAFQKITPQQLEKLKSSSEIITNWTLHASRYIKIYEKLVFLFSKTSNVLAWKQVSLNYVLDALFQFIIQFQDIHESEGVYEAKSEVIVSTSRLIEQTAYAQALSVIQKSWALYMKAYELLTKKEIAFSGILEEYTRGSNSVSGHIFYTRDCNGFLFSDFISLDDYKIQGNLYRRIIGYGKGNYPFYNNRAGYFFNDGTRFRLITTPLVQVTKLEGTNEMVRVECYNGEQTNYHMQLPPTAYKTFLHIVSVTLGSDKGLSLHCTFTPNEINPYQFDSKKEESIAPEICAAIEAGEKQLLHSKSANNSIIIPILNQLEKKEAYYGYLLELLESSQKPNLAPEVQNTIAYIEAYHQDKPLEVIIQEVEEKLELEYTFNYLSENESEIEATIRKEQEAVRDAVARGEHYNTSKHQSRAKSKQVKKGAQKPIANNIVIQIADKQRVASAMAKRKLNTLKTTLSQKKTWKYRQCTKLLNEASKAIEPLGLTMGGQLNKSSHGYLALSNANSNNNTVVTKEVVVRPHGDKPTVYASRFRSLLDSFNNAI